MIFHHIHLEETSSTSTYLKQLVSSQGTILLPWTVVSTHIQSQGRGQRGNSWESTPGENITLSLLLYPSPMETWESIEPFDLSIFVSLALCDFLKTYLPHQRIKIKWPNDIYVDNKKIAGILIENEWINTQLCQSIIGIGLNINQTIFISDAPNPTSLSLETQKKYPLQEVTRDLLSHLYTSYQRLLISPHHLRETYHSLLFYRDGLPHQFISSKGEVFEALLIEVIPSGLLSLRHIDDGLTRQYTFKEVSFKL